MIWQHTLLSALQIQSAGSTAPVSQSQAAGQPASDPELGTAVAAAQQALQTLQNSELEELDFDEAILTTVKLDLSAVERTQFGPSVMLDMAKTEFGAEPSHFNQYLSNLCLQLGHLGLDTQIAHEAMYKALNLKNEAELALARENE